MEAEAPLQKLEVEKTDMFVFINIFVIVPVNEIILKGWEIYN